MSNLPKLKNIGQKTSIWLNDIGIYSLEDIEELGVIETYRRLKASRPDVTLNALWGLQGAVIGLSYTQLPPEMKEDLLKQLNESEAETLDDI